MHVVVTGAAGNLGTKLRAMLERSDWCSRITGIDVRPFDAGPKASVVVADLVDPNDKRWIEPVRQADGIVHYASANPAPTSNWAKSAASFDMTANLLEQAGGEDPCRFVFASSNHAMGGYKDAPIPGDGKLRMETPQMSGTRYWDGEMYRWGSAYGATKALGERVCAARAAATGGRISAVSTRIGWCQRGDNLATTLSERRRRQERAQPRDRRAQPQVVPRHVALQCRPRPADAGRAHRRHRHLAGPGHRRLGHVQQHRHALGPRGSEGLDRLRAAGRRVGGAREGRGAVVRPPALCSSGLHCI